MHTSVAIALNLWCVFASATSVVWVSAVHHYSPIVLSFVQVDDRNASIVYEPRGAWNEGGTPREFNETTTWTFSPYASFSFTFTGLT